MANQYIITAIEGSKEFESFLLEHNICVGAIFTKEYAPVFFNLTTININFKTISLRNEDFKKIKWEIAK